VTLIYRGILLALKRKDVLVPNTTWMNLENITLHSIHAYLAMFIVAQFTSQVVESPWVSINRGIDKENATHTHTHTHI
jgi:hypothetical protein